MGRLFVLGEQGCQKNPVNLGIFFPLFFYFRTWSPRLWKRGCFRLGPNALSIQLSGQPVLYHWHSEEVASSCQPCDGRSVFMLSVKVLKWEQTSAASFSKEAMPGICCFAMGQHYRQPLSAPRGGETSRHSYRESLTGIGMKGTVASETDAFCFTYVRQPRWLNLVHRFALTTTSINNVWTILCRCFFEICWKEGV